MAAPLAAPMARPLASFGLEAWVRWGMARARHNVAASGVAVRDLADLGLDAAFWKAAWGTSPDEHTRQVQEALARAYGGTPDSFLVCLGASEADFAVALGALAPGDGAVVEQPAYFSLLEPARALGAKVTRVDWGAARGGRPTAEAFLARMDAATRLVALARPNNPTGHRMPDADLVRVAQAAQERGAVVLVDEVFAEATELGDGPAARLHPAIASVNSVTKCLGFGPLQVGWVQARPEVVAQARLAKWHTRPMVPSLDMAIAVRVLRERGRILAETRARRTRNVEQLRAFVEANDVAWTGAGEGTTCMLRCPQADDHDFAVRLLENQGVLVAPGSLIEMPGWIRLGLMAGPEVFQSALQGLAAAMA